MPSFTFTVSDDDVARIQAAVNANGLGTPVAAVQEYLFTLVQQYEQQRAVADAQAAINNPPPSAPLNLQITVS